MSHKKLRPFIVKVSVLGYFPLRVLHALQRVSTTAVLYHTACMLLMYYIVKGGGVS